MFYFTSLFETLFRTFVLSIETTERISRVFLGFFENVFGLFPISEYSFDIRSKASPTDIFERP